MFGRYELTRLLAVGGMAEIYLARAFGAEGFVKPLVIKRLDPGKSGNERASQLFINEAKLLASLNHSNIVPVFDFGRAGDDLYIAMEHVRGASLRDVLKALLAQGQLFSPTLAAYVVAEVCKGLDYAHRKALGDDSRGIIHRDIKPRNILVSDEGEVKLVDFGVAKMASWLDAGHLTGTLTYMSPEQAERQAVDARADIFSAGLVLFELLSGYPAYRGALPAEVYRKARQAVVPSLPEEIPEALGAIVKRATDRDPKQRFASAQGMESSLAEFLLQARSRDESLAGRSLASRLASLMGALPLERHGYGDAGIATPPAGVVPRASGGAGPGSAQPERAPELQGPPDLGLIKDAAETFYTEFMTRVLAQQGRRSLRRAALVAGPLAIVAFTLGLLFFRTAGKPPGSAPSPPLPAAHATKAPGPTTSGRPHAAERKLVAGPASVPAATQASKGRAPRPPSALARLRSHRPSGFGTLNLNSVPWSRVTLDGKRLSRPTPLLGLRLRAGWHQLRLDNAQRGLSHSLRIKIRAHRTTTKFVRLR